MKTCFGTRCDTVNPRGKAHQHNKHEPVQQQTAVTVKWMKNTASKAWHIFLIKLYYDKKLTM